MAKIFVINPGSTSTKLALYEDSTELFNDDIFHDSSELLKFPTINDQLPFRMHVLESFLQEHGIDLAGVDATVGRGGGCMPILGGTYRVNEQLLDDTRNYVGGLYHSSMLGVQMAAEIQKKYGGEVLMVDPPVVDELQDLARITGVKGIYRKAISHALNLKETARRHCASLGVKYEDSRLIVCHIDGGISVTAHVNGRMIDGNDAGGGEGPFTPTRMGNMAVTDVLNRLSDRSPKQIRDLCSQAGGLSSHFGTSNSDLLHQRMEDGDQEVRMVWQAMIYQVCRYIGAMSAVLKGKVDGIVLTGGLMRFADVGDIIREYCGWIAPVYIYPGEVEMSAMAMAALRVLSGTEEPLEYTGEPAWKGFAWDHQ